MPSNPDPSNSGKFAQAGWKGETPPGESERTARGRPIDPPSLPPWSRPPEIARETPSPARIPPGRPGVGSTPMGAPSRPARPVTVPLAAGAPVQERLPADEDATTQEPPDPERTLDEEIPTQRGARELARRLAEDVQRRMARPATEPLEIAGGDGPVTEKVNLDELSGPPLSEPPRPRSVTRGAPPSLRPEPLRPEPVRSEPLPPRSEPPRPAPRAEVSRAEVSRAEVARPDVAPSASRPAPPSLRPEPIRAATERPAPAPVDLSNREPVARPRVPPNPQEDPVRPDDPRELARRLAEEAKKRLAPPAPLPVPASDEPEPEPTSWESRRGGFEAIADPGPAPYGDSESDLPATPEPTDDTLDGAPAQAGWASAFGIGESAPEVTEDPDPEPPPDLPTTFARGRSLAERAAPVASAPQRMSAAEALAAARLAEAEAEAQRSRAARSAPSRAPTPATPASAPRAPSLAPASVPPAAPRPSASTGRAPDAAAVFAEIFPQAHLEAPIPVTQLEVFRALWRAHRARALHDGALELFGTSSVLLAAVDQGARVAAARVTLAGVTWAAWVDLDRRVLLGAARPAEIYLAGL